MMLLSIEYEEEAVFPQYQNNNFGHILAWNLDLKAFQPVLAVIFHVESEFAVQNARFKRPEA